MNDWTEGHELAALERLFEIGLERLRFRGTGEMATARALANCKTLTPQGFAGALQFLIDADSERIRTELAHVYAVVAQRERCEP